MAIVKWILGAAGWALAGPMGAVIGYSIGSVFDGANIKQLGSGQRPPFEQTRQRQRQRPQWEYQTQRKTQAQRRQQTQSGDFMISLIMLSAVVMRSDKQVTASEKKYVQQFMRKQFGQAQASQSTQIIDRVLQQKFSTREICMQIKQFMDHSSRLQMVQYLFGVAKADGYVDDVEVTIIEKIAGYLGISTRDYESIKAMFYDSRASAYKVLEVPKSASNDEIKKAYRRLAKKYHPDKVKHLGEAHQQSAKEKFQKLQDAYELVKKERRIK